jgi:hypothetical protein
MKYPFLACLLVIAGLTACSDKSSPPTGKSASTAPSEGGAISGKVVETIDTAGYTYVLLDTGAQKVWAAAPQSEVKAGDSVTVPDGMPMPNYHSKSLNRDFDVVYFAGGFIVNGAGPSAGTEVPSLPPGHPPLQGGAPASAGPKVDFSGIEKPAGGVTVSEIVTDPNALGGKAVAFRGKVVKYNPMILGKNWVHVQDGTGSPGSNNLVVTTDSEVKVGDTVLVNGTVTTDKDFGGGYKYKVIVEDATVKVE